MVGAVGGDFVVYVEPQAAGEQARSDGRGNGGRRASARAGRTVVNGDAAAAVVKCAAGGRAVAAAGVLVVTSAGVLQDCLACRCFESATRAAANHAPAHRSAASPGTLRPLCRPRHPIPNPYATTAHAASYYITVPQANIARRPPLSPLSTQLDSLVGTQNHGHQALAPSCRRLPLLRQCLAHTYAANYRDLVGPH